MKTKIRGIGRGVAGALLTLLVGSVAFADGPAINGYVDTQYHYNFDTPKSRTTAFRSYDAQDNDIDNTAHLALTGSVGEGTGYVVEIDAGSDAPITTSNAGEQVTLQEAYLTHKWGSGFGIKAGKFATFHGIEVIESPANPTITRGFLYGLAEPFTHVGGVLTYAMEKIDFAAGVINGWDVPNDNNPGKTLVGRVGFNFGDPLTFGISGHHGPEQAAIADDPTTVGVDETDNRSGANRSTIDLTGVTKIIPKVDLWFQALFGTEEEVLDIDGDGLVDDHGQFSGFTIQPVINVTDKFFVGARFEYFDDDGARTGTMDTVLRNITFTPGYKVTDNFQVRAEVRMDESNRKVFEDEDGLAEDKTTTGALQAILTY